MRLMHVKWGVLPVVLAALAACGGGEQPEGDAGGSVKVAGVVAKGPAVGAKVRIYAADGVTLLAGPVTTGAGGAYSADLSSKTGPFLVVADLEGATITDETDPTGNTTYTGVAGQTLRAVVETGSSAVHLTPFSDMAADLAQEAAGDGPLTLAAAQDANRKIRQILNNTDFLTASPTTGDLLVALKAVQTLVNENEGGLTAVLTQLRDAAGEGVVSKDFVESLQAACSDCSAAFNPGVAELPVEQTSGIDTVKALFQDLRDTLLAYSNDGGTGDLDQAGTKINDALAAAVQPVDDEQIKSLAMVIDADEMLRAFKAGTSEQRRLFSSGGAYGQVVTKQTNGTPVEPGWLPQFGCEVAKATIVSKPEGVDVEDYTVAEADVTSATANVVACYGVGTVGRLFPGVGDGYGYYHSLVLIPQGNSSYKYVHQLRKGRYDRTLLAPDEQLTSRVRAVYGSMTVARNTEGYMTGATISGKLIPGFKGHAAGEFATLDRVDVNLNIATAFGATDENANVSGSLVLMKKDGSQASRIDITSGSFAAKVSEESYSYTYEDVMYVGTGSCPVGYTAATWNAEYCVAPVTYTQVDSVSRLGTMTLDVSVAAPGVKFQGIATAGSASFDKSGQVYYPTVTSLQGQLSEADGTGYRVLLDGRATVELQNFASFDATLGNPSPLKVSFDGKVLLKNRPAMGFTLAGTRDASNNQNGTGSFYWNGKSLSFEAKADKSLVVRNDDGVTFTIPQNGGNSFQTVYKGTTVVGQINLDLQRINYADGTFQQY